MAKDWYQGRAPRGRGLVYRDCRIGLYPDGWEQLEKIAAERSKSRSYLISLLVESFLRENREREPRGRLARPVPMRAFQHEEYPE